MDVLPITPIFKMLIYCFKNRLPFKQEFCQTKAIFIVIIITFQLSAKMQQIFQGDGEFLVFPTPVSKSTIFICFLKGIVNSLHIM